MAARPPESCGRIRRPGHHRLASKGQPRTMAERTSLPRGLEVSRRTTADSADLDLLADFNVERIQAFLTNPYERVGEALEKVEERLAAQNITLADDLKREADRAPRANRPKPQNIRARPPGARARFGDGDGGFWDRWLTDAGCTSGSGEYSLPAIGVTPGFVAPRSGFKLPLGAPSPRQVVEAPPKPEEVKIDVDGRFFRAYAVAESDLRLSEKRALRALDASSSPNLSVAAQNLRDEEATALGRALTKTTAELLSLDVSRNALGKGLASVFRGAAAHAELETFDASSVPVDAHAMQALASALTSGFQGLRVLRLARCQLRVGAVVALCRALRSRGAPSLEELDLKDNALGDDDPRQEEDEHWFRAPFFGPLGALVGDATALDDVDREFKESEWRDGPLALTSLDVSSNRLQPEHVCGIAHGLGVARLRTLAVSDNPDLGDIGGCSLGAALSTVPLLEELSLANCGLRAKGAVVLTVGARQARYIHRVDVSGNRVGAAGVVLASLALDEVRSCTVVMRGCDFKPDEASEVHVDWLHLITVSDRSRPPPFYEFNVEDALDTALAAETLRLCARDAGPFAVASAVACVVTHPKRPRDATTPEPACQVEALPPGTRARRLVMVAPSLPARATSQSVFRLQRSEAKAIARTMETKAKGELELKLARRGKAVSRATLDLAQVEQLLKSIDSGATSKDAERVLKLLDFDGRGTVDASAAYRYALEDAPRLLRRRAAGAAFPRPLIHEESAFSVPTAGVLKLRCFLERQVRGVVGVNVLKLAQDLDDCVVAADLAARSRVKLDGDDALALAAAFAERDDCTDISSVALVAPLTVEPSAARCVRDALLGRLCSWRADAAERQAIVEKHRALRTTLGAAAHRAFLGPRDGRYALDLKNSGDRAALRELFAHDADDTFRNCRVDGSFQSLGSASACGGQPPKSDTHLAALFASEGAPSLGARMDGLVALDVASRAPPKPETTPALDSTVFLDVCAAFDWCRSDGQRRTWVAMVEGPRQRDEPTKRLFGGSRCAAAAFVELFRLRSLVKAGLPDVRRRKEPPVPESVSAARRRSAPDVALEDALDLIGAAPSVTMNQAQALLRLCPVADDGLPQAPAGDDKTWSTEQDACSGRRARLACALLAKLRAPIDVASLFELLTPPERARVVHQVGWANVWSPLRPDGCYVLDLSRPEDRQIARVLTHVEAAEAYSQLLDLRLLNVPSINNWAAPASEHVVQDNPWRRELPAKGVWAVTFKSKSEDVRDVDLPLRAALACLATTAPPEAFALVPDTSALFGPATPATVARQSRSQLKESCWLVDEVYDWERRIV